MTYLQRIRSLRLRPGRRDAGPDALEDRAGHGSAIFGALLTLVLLLLLAWRIGQWYEAQLLSEQRAAVTVEASMRGNTVATTINRRLTRLQSLYSFVQTQGANPTFPALFETYAAGLSSGAYGIRNVAVAPGGVFKYVYPLAGNESVIGYDPLEDERLEVRQDVQRAILSGDIILTGPVELVQGGTGLIARQAVHRNGRYWGLVSLVLDVPALLAEAGVNPVVDERQPPILEFAVRDDAGRVFSGPAQLFDANPVVVHVQVGDEQWELAAAPGEGWQTPLDRALLVYRLAVAAIAALLSLLVFLSIDRQSRLAQAVAFRTRALSAMNRQLEDDIAERRRTEATLAEREAQYRGIFESTTDALLIFDLQDGRLVDFNPAAHEMHGYNAAAFRRLQPADFIHPDYFDVFQQHLSAVRAGRNFRAQGVNVRRDGSSFPVDIHGVRFTHRRRPHTLAVMRDATEQVQTLRLLEQRVDERTRELRSLLNIGRTLASTLELEPLLAQILEQISSVVESAGVAVLRLNSAGDALQLLAYRSPIHGARLPEHWPLEEGTLDYQVITSAQCVIIADTEADVPHPRLWRERLEKPYRDQLTGMRALLAVPMLYKERVVGMINFVHQQPGFYNERHADLAIAFGNQAAVAIENARLYEQARSLAALQERQRLARELHDSVSQALYGIALGSRTARAMIDRASLPDGQTATLSEPLDYVLSLAEAALTEMRALIFELRPESLQAEGLVAALQRQADALQARHAIQVTTTFDGEPDLPLPAKECLYRVAQEAVHNTVKHAAAQRLQISLRDNAQTIVLTVCDDGRGFDVAQSFPGHLGLQSMRERVQAIGGALQIQSKPGDGTCVRVEIGAALSLASQTPAPIS